MLLLLATMATAQTVTFPDGVFKAIMLVADTSNTFALDSTMSPIKIDANNDGEIQYSEAAMVYRLNLGNLPIADLTGISAFTNLRHLDCYGNQLTSLDLTGVPLLSRLNCAGNQLTSLNIANLHYLTFVFCDGNELLSLDLAGLTNLIFLSCQNNNLTTLSLNGLSSLSGLICGDNQLTTLNGSGAPQLTSIQCDRNLLTSIDISSNPNLTLLSCFYNQLTTLDLSNQPLLNSLSCGENNISSLNLDGLSNLTSLECSYLPNNLVINAQGLNLLTNFSYVGQNTTLSLNGFPAVSSMNLSLSQPAVTLNLSGLNSQATLYLNNGSMTALTVNGSGTTNLGMLNCSSNQLTSLSLNNLSGLNGLDCSNNKFTTLNLANLPGLTTLNFGRNKLASINLSNLANLKHLDANNNKLTSLDVSGLPALEYLDCSNNVSHDIIGNQLTSLAVSGLTNLRYLDFSNHGFNGALGAAGNQLSALNVNDLVNLEQLKCSKNNISSLSINSLTNLVTLDCSYNSLTNLNLSALTNLENLNYSNNQLSNVNLDGLTKIKTLECFNNAITSLDLSDMPNLEKLNCMTNSLTTLNLSGLNLKELYCDNNQLTSLDVNSMDNLMMLSCSANQLATIEVYNLQNLRLLNCSGNQLTNINVGMLTNLSELYCEGNQLTFLNVNSLYNLSQLRCDFNQLTTLDLTGMYALFNLSCSFNQLTTLDLTTNYLYSLNCRSNQISAISFNSQPQLATLDVGANLFMTLNLSDFGNLMNLYCDNNLLTELNIKNGRMQSVSLENNPSLAYICADDNEVQSVQNQLNALGMTSTVCNSYCSFTPGGPHNTVTGTTIFDGNNNGCNQNDPLHPNIRVDFTDGATTGSAFTNTDGICTFYANAGNYTLFPNIENASAFTISPASAAINFPDNNYNVSNQSFCLAANGVHPDLEIVVSPITPARPGFDAVYQIVYKNKGNQMLSGNVFLSFDDTRMVLISAQPTVDTQTTGNLTWNYSGLLPFESRTIKIEFNVNAPLETPSVNNGDILPFTTSITPVSGDETPNDNAFSFDQVVVNSFDPNDITCIEGEIVPPSEIGKYLHYIVNFENTGTASAVNVVVKVEIDETKYDLHSLQVMSTSHPSRSLIKGNVAEFIFQNIDLAEAAGNPPVGGHGNILFKIRTLESLVTGDQVKKTANIFFDYNAPIVTNDAITTFNVLSNPHITPDTSIKLYPNPASDFINISCDTSVNQVELFDIQGRLLQTTFENKKEVRLNVSSKAKGIYFVRITTEKGKKVEKMIKE